ncbi:MAG: glycosyltransferase family 4 protein [Lachnospiraceae bacterium]|nr:glycosyltransferase family 4 protein [Lachnospiraceae bacterium]
MILLSDCLTEKIDEGCLKVANSLTKRIKRVAKDTTIISYDRKPDYSDIHLSLNKLFLNKELLKLLCKKKEPVLYIPFASNTTASCLRTLILSFFCNRKVNVLFVLRFPMKSMAKILLKLSGAKVIALSEVSFLFYKEVVGNRAIYLKTGIDTEKFVPVSKEQKQELREKYHIPKDKKVLLHVGHLKGGRNVDKLVGVDTQYYIVLVVSSVTEAEKDASIRVMLEMRGNVTIIDSYLENVQEVYQMADVYLFPVQEVENCIDIPLSVLEAASCNLAIVTTEYGELSAFKNQEGFHFINDLSPTALNKALEKMTSKKQINNRQAVMEYDWNCSIDILQKI